MSRRQSTRPKTIDLTATDITPVAAAPSASPAVPPQKALRTAFQIGTKHEAWDQAMDLFLEIERLKDLIRTARLGKAKTKLGSQKEVDASVLILTLEGRKQEAEAQFRRLFERHRPTPGVVPT